jgi:hypothetical protein
MVFPKIHLAASQKFPWKKLYLNCFLYITHKHATHCRQDLTILTTSGEMKGTDNLALYKYWFSFWALCLFIAPIPRAARGWTKHGPTTTHAWRKKKKWHFFVPCVFTHGLTYSMNSECERINQKTGSHQSVLLVWAGSRDHFFTFYPTKY